MDLLDLILDHKEDLKVNWNTPYFYIANCFSYRELCDMDNYELKNLIRLGNYILEGDILDGAIF